MIDGYIRHFGLKPGKIDWKAEAKEWSVTRGARSGRVAWQYIQDLAGRLGQHLNGD
jgi:predicted AAA+ superfamily ATPase